MISRHFLTAILLCILLCVLLTVLVAFGSFCFIKFIHLLQFRPQPQYSKFSFVFICFCACSITRTAYNEVTIRDSAVESTQRSSDLNWWRNRLHSQPPWLREQSSTAARRTWHVYWPLRALNYTVIERAARPIKSHSLAALKPRLHQIHVDGMTDTSSKQYSTRGYKWIQLVSNCIVCRRLHCVLYDRQQNCGHGYSLVSESRTLRTFIRRKSNSIATEPHQLLGVLPKLIARQKSAGAG